MRNWSPIGFSAASRRAFQRRFSLDQGILVGSGPKARIGDQAAMDGVKRQ
jgi:hypothetical protein